MRLVGRLTRSTLVLTALCLWLAAFGIATSVETALGAVVPVVLFGVGIGFVFPSTFAWVETLAPPDRQGQFSSYIASFGYTGQFLSLLLFGPLIPFVGIRGVFAVAAAAAGIGAAGLGLCRYLD